LGSRRTIVRLLVALIALGGVAPAATSESDSRILFEDSGRLYLVDPTTAETTDLRSEGGTPWWSPDGDRIAFVRNPYGLPGRPSELWVVNADGSQARNLTPSITNAARPEWSPDGSHLAFTGYDRQRQRSQLYVVRADGSGLRRLVAGAQPAVPRWSPDGTKILFQNRIRPSVWALFVVDVETARVRRLVGRIDYGGISWSPDGRRIAFLLGRRLHVAHADGTGRTRISRLPVLGLHAWAPDGSRVAFQSHGSAQRAEIYSANVRGTGLRQLTRGVERGAADRDPAWSPDGSKLAFSSNRDRTPGTGTRNVYVMNADGSCERRLTRGAVAASVPAWRPGRVSGPPLRCVDLRVTTRLDAEADRISNDSDRVYRYEIDVRNEGNERADGVELAFARASAATFVSATAAGGSCETATSVSCRLGSLAGGDVARIVVRFRLFALGRATIRMSPTATSAQPDADAYDNGRPVQGTFPFCHAPDRDTGTILAWPWTGELICGGSRNDRISGSDSEETLHGGDGHDVLDGRRGKDLLFGENGNDALRGGFGNDGLQGGSGRDRLTGGAGEDGLHGGSGNDLVRARDGCRDYVWCGRGRDRVVADWRDTVAKNCERVER
jgi:Tol biopolymer transport system component